MDKKIQHQIEDITENVTSYFMDAYYCYDWKMSATEFACLLIAEIQNKMLIIAYELDNPDDEVTES